jgi:hypothetical protein
VVEETFTITMEKDKISQLIFEIAEIVGSLTIALQSGDTTTIPKMKLWIEFGEKLLEATSNED